MKINKIIAIIATFGTINSYAGVTALTHHSRANCLGINESISWQLGRTWDLAIESTHWVKNAKSGGRWIKAHSAETGYEWTWRQADMCMLENITGTYQVTAIHSVRTGNKVTQYKTEAVDCNIYDGWWDSDHPERKS